MWMRIHIHCCMAIVSSVSFAIVSFNVVFTTMCERFYICASGYKGKWSYVMDMLKYVYNEFLCCSIHELHCIFLQLSHIKLQHHIMKSSFRSMCLTRKYTQSVSSSKQHLSRMCCENSSLSFVPWLIFRINRQCWRRVNERKFFASQQIQMIV